MEALGPATAVVSALALVFAFTNGFHDAANAVAASVSTRAITTHRALAMAAGLNALGALLSTQVALTVGSGLLEPDDVVGPAGLVVVGGALVGAICWNLITWWLALPSSSSHALLGALAGAGLAGGVEVHWGRLLDVVVAPMVAVPLLGFATAWAVTTGLRRLLAARPYHPTMRRFRLLETVASALTALGHGLQDAQKTMGVMLIALVAGGMASTGEAASAVPLWVRLSAAAALGAGTWAGGARIIRTLGARIARLDAAQGFVAQAVTAAVLAVSALGPAAPVSTTHTIAASITGAGGARRMRHVHWGVLGRIAFAWVATLPVAGVVGALVSRVLARLLGL
ncbi:inorganic phosphate transporter [Actinomyces bowdenii]|uniref:Inorganic phosphate transporter n=1 Tax=Actinomyces bowdenii TaxID=131109 RepID=A0A3P1VEC3_9ACTO|nr:inorganic phosphate transporter [Actinomyces bowdenii]MBO3725278.1 inorganic phosphate transporter [Actinomyces bowdenii]RRD30873.1 inorganic phosphate transporter [Actinomyces bowdenii]